MSFRFYNAYPGDWQEGALQGHLYELKFRDPPAAEQKAAIADRYEKLLAHGPAKPAGSEPWLWSGAFAHFLVAERWLGSPQNTFAKVRELVNSIGQIAPLSHAAFLGAIDEENRSPPPGPVPPPGVDTRKVDKSLPAMAPDPGFEDARKRAKSEVVLARAEKASAESGLTLVPVPADQPRDEPTTKDWGALQVPEPLYGETGPRDGDHPFDETGRLAQIWRDEIVIGLAYLDRTGKRRELDLSEFDLARDLRGAMVVGIHGSDEYALVFLYRDLYRLDFANGELRQVWRSDEGWAAVAPLGDLWAVRTAEAVHVLDLTGEKAEPVARLKKKGNWSSIRSTLEVVVPGCVLAAGHSGRAMSLLGYAKGKLKVLSSLKGKWSPWTFRVHGHLAISAYGTRDRFTVHGIESLYEAWAKPVREKAAEAARKKPKRARAQTTKMKLAVELLEIRGGDVPEERVSELHDTDPSLTETDVAFFRARWLPNVSMRAHRAESGHLATFVNDGDATHLLGGVAWRAPDGDWNEVPVGPLYSPKLSIAPAGDLIVVGKGSELGVVIPEQRGTFKKIKADLGKLKPKRFELHSDGVWAVGPDDLLHWYSQTAAWYGRDGKRWRNLGTVKLPGLIELRVEPSQRLLVARSKNKQRLLVFAQRGENLIRLKAFTERISAIRVVDGRIYAIASADEKAYELVNAGAVADEKAKSAAKR